MHLSAIEYGPYLQNGNRHQQLVPILVLGASGGARRRISPMDDGNERSTPITS
ncbi:hypothetical protein RHGRI_010827 [Rhododendron griersonianum]|uniref:Uncharacterized protein n=1 Tax=Rhododendron griersonianum TaxID=479676 RepID=A0AAV6KJW2_9ERIC|nr:hypothetical protein RHGRI_021915 [Rhododendron griersonianum]KAG5552847.1 hypothetical protein RHGRI_010827 [Rhododendron griersonianum]